MAKSARDAASVEKEVVKKADDGDETAQSYLRSYHLIRTGAGLLGFFLPPLVVFGWMWLSRKWGMESAQGSLSAYYHTGMRDFFVGILVIVGILLYTYKVAERNIDNRLSTLAGISAVGVALVPTGVPAGGTATPIQSRINQFGAYLSEEIRLEEWLPAGLYVDGGLSQVLHYFFAIVFIGSLMILCAFFAIREGDRELERLDSDDGKAPWQVWATVHWGMAVGILISAAYIIVTQITGWKDERSILYGEWGATAAFGVSWFIKGLDFRALRVDVASQAQAGANQTTGAAPASIGER